MPPQNIILSTSYPSTESLSEESISHSGSRPMLRNTSISHLSQEADKVKEIRDVIRAEDKRLRAAYPLLREEWQDVVGLVIFTAAVLAWFSVSYLWYQGVISTGWTIIFNALSVSILHEMEHDLIHDLYFKRSKLAQDIMFTFIWLLKSNANPWWRRYYHLRHHQYAGQVVDVEERLIGLGMPWYSFKRMLVTLTPAGTLLVAGDIARDDPEFSQKTLVAMNSPIIALSTIAMIAHAVLKFGLFAALPPHLQAIALAYVLPILVTYNCTVNFPNILRQSCLVIISTYCHYYGDIPDRDVFFQTQILDHWLLYPFQLFCFNFGATHIIHHFVTRQPFYLRQIVAFRAIPLMKEHGCRHNDLANNFRGNRWNQDYDVATGQVKKGI